MNEESKLEKGKKQSLNEQRREFRIKKIHQKERMKKENVGRENKT